jgi:hypothetical protein
MIGRRNAATDKPISAPRFARRSAMAALPHPPAPVATTASHPEQLPELRASEGPSTGGGLQAVLDRNRDITFGYLLGYLTLALHTTLEYTRFQGFFLRPWEDVEVGPADRPARGWRRRVCRTATYGPEVELGEIVALISDGPEPPRRTFELLGVPDPDPEPARRIPVRMRIPRVDLVVAPTPGHAYDLTSFAREVGVRFSRQLD